MYVCGWKIVYTYYVCLFVGAFVLVIFYFYFSNLKYDARAIVYRNNAIDFHKNDNGSLLTSCFAISLCELDNSDTLITHVTPST